jgi:hypothetical protein
MAGESSVILNLKVGWARWFCVTVKTALFKTKKKNPETKTKKHGRR